MVSLIDMQVNANFALKRRIGSVASSSIQGLSSGLCVGFFGAGALPLLILTVPLDVRSLSKLRSLSNKKSPNHGLACAASAAASMGINALLAAIGVSVIATISPMGTETRQAYFKVLQTTTVASNSQSLGEQAANLLTSTDSFWLTDQQKQRLREKITIAKSVQSQSETDAYLRSRAESLDEQLINKTNYVTFLSAAEATLKNARANVAIPVSQRKSLAKKILIALSFAQTAEKERISKLPRKFQATLTNCFVDAPCDSFDRVATFADGKVTVGDFSCKVTGEGGDDGYGACSVSMQNGRPVYMRRWNPINGFETTRAVIAKEVRDGTYNKELEADPYIKLQDERWAKVLESFKREKENERLNCTGLHGQKYIECAGAQIGN